MRVLLLARPRTGHASLQSQALDALADVFLRNDSSLAGLAGTLGSELTDALEAALARTTPHVALTLDQKHAMLAYVEQRAPGGLTVLETLAASNNGG